MSEIIIGIDNGYGYLKTANTIILNGVNQLDGEPNTLEDILEFEGTYYSIGESRLPYLEDKTETQEHYLGTLSGVAKELQKRGMNHGNIVLGVGVPYSFHTRQKEAFKKYILQKENVKFMYSGVKYSIKIEDAFVFPQAYPILYKDIAEATAEEKLSKKVVIDIGSGTVDIVVFRNKKPINSESFSIPGAGTISCIKMIQKAFVNTYNFSLDEEIIQEYMSTGGKKSKLPKEYRDLIEKEITLYATRILQALMENGINIKVQPVTFCGGGATLIKKYGTYTSMVKFNENLCANAQGFEELAKAIRARK